MSDRIQFESVIGLEIHAQLLTETKIFCGCSAKFGAQPNTHVCPVCLGLPGALPVLNKVAVEYAIRAGLSLGCTVQPVSVFARKNYFYPDLPKGYQISQYEQPLATSGCVEYQTDSEMFSVGITRVHLEEDAGKSLHEGFSDSSRSTHLDFNRSGVPLIEIVTDPDLRSGAAAADFFGRLRAILRTVGINDGNMEEGSLRCDANVSVRPVGVSTLGVKVEVKNINSFKFLRRAIEYEFKRQKNRIIKNETIKQETRLWDDAAGLTISMRTKEEAHDYRYFPEPDLLPLEISSEWVNAVQEVLPELPDDRKQRFVEQYKLTVQESNFLTQSIDLADYFEAAAKVSGKPKLASNWVMGEVSRKIKEANLNIASFVVSPESLSGLISLIDKGVINNSVAKKVFDRMCQTGDSADEIVRLEGLAQIDDVKELDAIVSVVIKSQSDAVESYRLGKKSALGFLVGQVIRETGGKANPRVVSELLRDALEQ